jgi:hypothetical protein
VGVIGGEAELDRPAPDAFGEERGVVAGLLAHDGVELAGQLGAAAEFDAVVWATGFTTDHSWVDVPGAHDQRGRILHKRGVTPSPGLYLLGLTWQHTRTSALLGWVRNDAAFLAERIASRADDSVGPGRPPAPPRHRRACGPLADAACAVPEQATASVTAKSIEYPTGHLRLASPAWPWRPTALPALAVAAAIGAGLLPAAGARRNRR